MSDRVGEFINGIAWSWGGRELYRARLSRQRLWTWSGHPSIESRMITGQECRSEWRIVDVSELLTRGYLSLYAVREKLQNGLKLALVPDESLVRRQYQKRLGKKPDLANPTSFTEKLQWRKLRDRNPLYAVCSDKYAVREYVAAKIGEQHLVPLLGVYDSAWRIDFGELPEQFVIKATHGSGWNLVVRDKSQLDTRKARLQLAKWLLKDFYPRKREWPYKHIKPRLVIEKLLPDENGNIPTDYKAHVFNGPQATELIFEVITNRFSRMRADYFDEQWNQLEILPGWKNIRTPPPKPECLEKIVAVSRKLSEDFNDVRVDLYAIGGQVYFGELTFCPCAGYLDFESESLDLEWGRKFHMPASA